MLPVFRHRMREGTMTCTSVANPPNLSGDVSQRNCAPCDAGPCYVLW